MSKTILTEVDGWTPLIDSIVQAHGVLTAAVFGRVWRYCQMADGVCTASQERIAADLDMNFKTAAKHLDILVENGYLRKEKRDGRTDVYYDTGKARLRSTITAVDQPARGRKKQAEPLQKMETTPPKNGAVPLQNLERSGDEPLHFLEGSSGEPLQKVETPLQKMETTPPKNGAVPLQNLETKKVLRNSLRNDEREDSRESSPPVLKVDASEAWQAVLGQLRTEMTKADFDTWVKPLIPPAGLEDDDVYRIEGFNKYGLDWCQSRLGTKISRLISPFYGKQVHVKFALRHP